ncbi:MAG: hypothetical protein ACKOW2_09185 [Sphingobacteriaceae bacterium]
MKANLFLLLKLILTVLWVAGIYWATTALTDPEKAAEFSRKLLPIAQSPYFLLGFMGFLVLAMLVLFIPIKMREYKQNALRNKLAQEGVVCTAEIIRVSDTGITINKNPRVKITVLIRNIEATFETTVSRINPPKAGDWIAVIYDPKDPRKALAVTD